MSITEWRWAIRDSTLPWHAKLVAYTLSTRMDANGDGCRPSGSTLAADCDIGRTMVTYAIRRLRADGWIKVTTRPGIGNEYHPVTPRPGQVVTTSSGDKEVVTTRPGGGHVVTTKNNKKINKKINTLSVSEFDQFWSTYPRLQGKGAARTAFTRARKKVSLEVILSGAQRLRDDPNREQQFTPYPAKWLNQEQWGDDPLPPRSRRPPSPITAADRAMLWAMKEKERDGQIGRNDAGEQAGRELPANGDR